MYLFTYAYDDDDTNELYSEYHLGRQAFRICKKGTKYCAWHREMPDFKQWRSTCVVSAITYFPTKLIILTFRPTTTSETPTNST